VAGGWRSLHTEELHDVYALQSIIRVTKLRRMRGAEHIVITGEMRNAYKILVGKPEGKRLCGKMRRRWEDNIKMDRK
jgi:hypothetical protein